MSAGSPWRRQLNWGLFEMILGIVLIILALLGPFILGGASWVGTEVLVFVVIGALVIILGLVQAVRAAIKLGSEFKR